MANTKAIKPKPKIIAKPQPIAKAAASVQKTVATTTTATTATTTAAVVQSNSNLDENMSRLSKLKTEYKNLENTKEEQKKPFVKQPAPIKHSKPESRDPNELIIELKNKLKQAEQRLGEMEGDVLERDAFISENLSKLEDGNRAYQEIINIYEEMKVEMQETMYLEIEFMEKERLQRKTDLEKQSKDIRVFEVLLDWFDKNSEFFTSLAEYNNIISGLETKFNNGLSFDKELSHLLSFIPNTFLSKQLLNDLETDIHNNKTNLVYSHSQLYDRFCIVEKSLRETSMTPRSTDSLWGNLFAKMFSSVLMREQISREGIDAQSRISRAGYAMKNGDLQSALTELNHLDDIILYPAQDWLRCARERLLGIYAIDMLKAELLSRSLNIGYTTESQKQ